MRVAIAAQFPRPVAVKRRLQSFMHAFRGIAEFIRIGANAKIQLLAAIVALAGGWRLGLSRGEWLAVLLCIGLVLAMEAMNSALEVLANEVSEERRPRIRQAKDMAAGAVLIAAITSLAVAGVILCARMV